MGGTESKQKRHWVPDDRVSACGGCAQPFSVSRRKHHCRSCGGVFCDDCSKWKAFDPQHMQPGETDRVCRTCFDVLTAVASNRGGGNGVQTNGNALNGAQALSSQHDAPLQPRRPPVVVTRTSEPSLDDMALQEPEATSGTALFEAAMNQANARFVDVKGCGLRTSWVLKFTTREIERDLVAAGGVTHLIPADSHVTIHWSQHAMPSIDASATFFTVPRDAPPHIMDAHTAVGKAAGILSCEDAGLLSVESPPNTLPT
jgi:hypothetical protein